MEPPNGVVDTAEFQHLIFERHAGGAVKNFGHGFFDPGQHHLDASGRLLCDEFPERFDRCAVQVGRLFPANDELASTGFGNAAAVGYQHTIDVGTEEGRFGSKHQQTRHNVQIRSATQCQEVLAGNVGNTFNRSFVRTVTGVFSDGTFSTHWSDPTGSALVSGSEQWTTTYTITCGVNAPQTFTQTGQLVGIEAVTVPAGTYNAYRLESAVSWTSGSLTTNETIHRWVNADPTQPITVKITFTYAYSGAVPASGALMSDSRVLQSVTN